MTLDATEAKAIVDGYLTVPRWVWFVDFVHVPFRYKHLIIVCSLSPTWCEQNLSHACRQFVQFRTERGIQSKQCNQVCNEVMVLRRAAMDKHSALDIKLCFRSLKRRPPPFLQSGASHSIFNAKSSLKLSEWASCRMYEASAVSSDDIILKTNISVPLWHFELGQYSYCSSFSWILSHLLYFKKKKTT